MKKVLVILSLIISIVLIVLLSSSLGPAPAAGPLLDPFHGIWQNSESGRPSFSGKKKLTGLEGDVEVYYDKRRVPHIFAEDPEDLYFAQGYVTARDRLFQMELSTYAAAGRITEVMGHLLPQEKTIAYDRNRRRWGMSFAAERALEEVNSDPVSKATIEAYAAGVNAYINSLSYDNLPLEYKLLDIRPEPWTPLKTCLHLKNMSERLTGYSQDIEMTRALQYFGQEKFHQYYPNEPQQVAPIVPGDSSWQRTHFRTAPLSYTPDRILPELPATTANPHHGSNNWAVSGKKTASGYPILCNDPHLGLTLPAIWYEIQLHGPESNCYGASMPGAPGIIIGFNDSIAWGVTNAARDVLDWYKIDFDGPQKTKYKFNGSWLSTEKRIEEIKVRGGESVFDTVIYTQHGPVVYDNQFPGKDSLPFALAMRWTAHDPSNEMQTFLRLNQAKNYHDYTEALRYFSCPGQNFVFASNNGDIALWQQGKFPDKHLHQGRWIMDGSDSSHLWKGIIPQKDNPHYLNPSREFVSSANQQPTDSTYPWHISGRYEHYRNRRINEQLTNLEKITPQMMMKLQRDNYNMIASEFLPLLLRHLDRSSLSKEAEKAAQMLSEWDYINDPNIPEPTLFEVWFTTFEAMTWADETDSLGFILPTPQPFVTYTLLQDSVYDFVDNVSTPEKETLEGMVTTSLEQALKQLKEFEESTGKSREWVYYNNVHIDHLVKVFSTFGHSDLPTGGNYSIVNAAHGSTGPSWKMVVELGPEVHAWGIFPGGQSGNPACPNYDHTVKPWANGEYFELLFLSTKDDASKQGLAHQTLIKKP